MRCHSAVAALFFLVGCAVSEPKEAAGALVNEHGEPVPALASLVHTGGEALPLSGTILTDDPLLGVIGDMVVHAGKLWATDLSGDPFLHMVDLDREPTVLSLGRAGAGPGDFREVSSLSVRPGDLDGVWAFDIQNRRLTRIVEGAPLSQARTISAADGESVMAWNWVAPDMSISIGKSATGRYTVRGQAGEALTTSDGQLVGDDSIPMALREVASTGVFVCGRPRGGVIAVAHSDAGRIDIIDSSGVVVSRANTPFKGSDAFFLGPTGTWRQETARLYYRDCTADDNAIYALFSGRSQADFSGAELYRGEYIHVFAWTGELLRILKLDRPASSVAVAPDRLFAASRSVQGIVSYPLLSN